jgi:hypothetical protein
MCILELMYLGCKGLSKMFNMRSFEGQRMTLFSSRVGASDSAPAATVFLLEHCSSFYFFSAKNYPKID